MKNAINWFEIPAKDFARAKDFLRITFIQFFVAGVLIWLAN